MNLLQVLQAMAATGALAPELLRYLQTTNPTLLAQAQQIARGGLGLIQQYIAQEQAKGQMQQQPQQKAAWSGQPSASSAPQPVQITYKYSDPAKVATAKATGAPVAPQPDNMPISLLKPVGQDMPIVGPYNPVSERISLPRSVGQDMPIVGPYNPVVPRATFDSLSPPPSEAPWVAPKIVGPGEENPASPWMIKTVPDVLNKPPMGRWEWDAAAGRWMGMV